ncbi:HTTM domain-containing protein [Aquimarina algiphila]|uniref:HTTM domain-containing protein n=1 Tax=Aquimarina algiphila TaxID=2047982 RepID=A0A554VH40_9FLAO|nr:HTTM domain-containing protein [Aquimarina algiphila]TSE06783.1 HTTM domain-containing protein [Aquimarina algiphila]
MEIKQAINVYLNKTSRAATLAAFRILFGMLMLMSLVRFLSKGWVNKFYIEPIFHFKYYGFSWVVTWGEYTYILFFVAIISCVGIILGYKYRLSIVLFFLSFTYIELIDKTTYLNHYYFISILSFLLCFLPLNVTFSLDSYYKNKSYKNVPKWTVDAIKVLIGVVYFYAGLAKLNSDWLFRAQPLKIWLSSKTDFPIIGKFMNDTWFHYLMSWSGAIYDLTIPFLLLIRKTRPFAFILVVIFHVFTRVLFPIGVFPYVMICATLIFFSGELHEKFLRVLGNILKLKSKVNDVRNVYLPRIYRKVFLVVCLFLSIQLVLPFRYVLYPGELFWTEEGYRFSWRVMLMEKAGYTSFRIVKYDTGNSFTVDNKHFLNAFQNKQMSTQPDFIVEYAHFLGDHYKKELENENIGVFVEGYISLNGRLSQPYIDPRVDLLKVKDGFQHKTWILPFEDEIKGL